MAALGFTAHFRRQSDAARASGRRPLRQLGDHHQVAAAILSSELSQRHVRGYVRLGYNLIRTIIAQAALKHDLLPRSISFKGASQTLEAFQPLIEFRAAHDTALRLRMYHNLLDAIATHRVADRPDRYEPRLRKWRRNRYDWLTKPRAEVKRDMAKGVTEI